MHWVAPSEKDIATGALEKRLWKAAGQLRAKSGLILVAFLFLTTLCPARAAGPLTVQEWTVDGVPRQALLYVPPQAQSNAVPVVFAFHGHGGSMRSAARSFSIHTEWPDVIVVYPQGLNTPGRLTDPEGRRPGWQKKMGDLEDRDLKFFDAMLATLESEHHVDTNRLYATGHSNGGAFTYLLWAARGDQLAAVAPSSALDAKDFPRMKPKPVLHIAGENDPLVKFAWQERMINAVRKLNQCGAGEPWENEEDCTICASEIDAPVVTFIHPGTHTYPAAAPPLIVKFFKQHSLEPLETK